MDVSNRGMHPLPTTQHFAAVRTDDDISAAVHQFLTNEGAKLHGKTWQDTTAEITKWLGIQIQREREGWRQKTRAAMQEIENHRKETLKQQQALQECCEQMKLVAECCSIPEETMNHIENEEPRTALPMYIQIVTSVINTLMEDRIVCLQILRAEDKASEASLPSLLKAYIEALKHHAERAHREAKSRLETLEVANKQSYTEMQRMRKAIQKKQEELEKLHEKLQEIKEVTLKKFKEVHDIRKEKESALKHKQETSSDEKVTQTDAALKQSATATRTKSSSSMYSAPTPVPPADQNITISEEKLSKLRRSAKKLETSLNDAISQMENYKMVGKGLKVVQHSPPASTPSILPPALTGKPVGLFAEVPVNLKKEIQLLPSALHTWSTKFEINGPKLQERNMELIRQQEKEKYDKKQRAKEKRKEAMSKSQDKSGQDQPTFRSLMKSLDEVKKNKGKSFKPVGQVTKCLRCNKLFTLNDNHKKACNFHPKGKERIEQYSDRGKLVKVSYVWKCCMAGPDNPGCTYGQHV